MKRRGGFTLIEMIGVLAVIAILAAMVAPKIFKVINDSRVTRMAGDIRGISAGVADWYKDVRTLNPLHATTGAIVTGDNTTWNTQLFTSGGVTAGLWARWQGPYIEDLSAINSIGSTATIENCAATAAAVASGTCVGVDFDGDGATDVAAGRRIVWLVLQNVADADFQSLDDIMDPGQTALTAAQRQARGKVKWDGTSVLRVYLASN